MKNTFKRQWEEFMKVWNKIGFGRPNGEVCLTFFRRAAEHLKDMRGSRIVILGSTPEFRDLCYVLSRIFNSTVFSVDMSGNTYYIMTRLTVFRNRNERFIHADWSKMPIRSGSIDIVMTDSGIANVPVQTRDKVFREISRIMKLDAIFLDREDTIGKRIGCDIDIKKEYIKQAKNMLNGKKNILDACGEVCEVMMRSSALNNHFVGFVSYYEDEVNKLKERYSQRDDPVSRCVCLLIELSEETYFNVGEKPWTCFTSEMYMEELSGYFILEKKIVPKSYDVAELSMYFWRKR